MDRRSFLKTSAWGPMGIALGLPPELFVLQKGEQFVEFSDYTSEFRTDYNPGNPRVRFFDLRRLDSWATPRDEFFSFHQTSAPAVAPAGWRLRIGGSVERPREFTLEEIRGRPDVREEGVTLECSGNIPAANAMNGLVSNATWKGAGLASILNECGLKANAREILFLGADMEREPGAPLDTPHGRSVFIQDALKPEAMLAFEMNGETLSREHGFPLRVILPGWYGMTQIKWLTRIEVLDTRYEGRHMSRNYHSVRLMPTGGDPVLVETGISRKLLKSVVARVTRSRQGNGFQYRISGAAWAGSAPVRSVEVRIDDGEWRLAQITERRGRYSWVLWAIEWKNPTPGEHTLVSRAIDEDERIQPTAEERGRVLKTARENNAQWPRRVVVR